MTLTGGDKRPKGTIIGKHPGAPSRTTIIITTHYIEEAKQCSIVGMMSDGRLLAEDMPQTLLNLHNAMTLEQVFLKLCIKQRSPKFTSGNRIRCYYLYHVLIAYRLLLCTVLITDKWLEKHVDVFGSRVVCKQSTCLY